MKVHASFRATNSWHESITKHIGLVYRLEKVFDTQSKGIGYLVESRKRWICPMVYELTYLLFRDTYTAGKFTVSHVFFCNTSYSLSCDTKSFFFIAFV